MKCKNCKKLITPGSSVRFVKAGVVDDFDGELEIADYEPSEEYVEHDWNCTPPKKVKQL